MSAAQAAAAPSNPAPTAADTHQAAHQLPLAQQLPAYLVHPGACAKRVRGFGADGQEEAADDNPWVHMQLKDPFLQEAADGDAAAADGGDGVASTAAGAADEDEQPPKPDDVIKAFVAAKGELEWLQAMLNTLLEGRYLTVGRSERSQGLQRLADLAIGANSRFRRRTATAASAAAALSEGAAALTALGAKQDAFYEQVALLQRYWKVRQEPADSPYEYSVNVNLAQAAPQHQQTAAADGSSSSAGAAAGDSAAALVGRGSVPVVYILKDPAGLLRVQVPAPKHPGPPTVMFKAAAEPPTVYTGPAAIHGLLLQQLRLNAWHMVLSSLEAEIAHMLGLPARLPTRLRPSRTVAAAQQQQQEQQQEEGGGVPLPPPQQARQPSDAAAQGDIARTASVNTQQQQQRAAAFAAGGHLTFYATLSSLALQSVAGAAATAGESAILQQQHQQRQQNRQLQLQLEQQQQQNGSSSAVEASSTSQGLLLLGGDDDVGEPWNRAAAQAAAAVSCRQPASNGNTSASQGAAGEGHSRSSSSSSSLVSPVCIDPQLLSLRPLTLEHLLITQLGHLLSGHLGNFSDPVVLAAVTYAATARQMHERVRQQATLRQQQQQQQGGAAGGGGGRDEAGAGAAGGGGGAGSAQGFVLKPGSYVFGAALSFMTSVSRWLAHAAARDVLRDKVDAALQQQAGSYAATSVSSSHACVSALQVAPCRRPPHAGALAPPADAAATAPPLLLLLSDAALCIEGTGVSAAAAAAAAGGGGGSTGHKAAQGINPWQGSPAQHAALGVQLHALPGVLEQLLSPQP